MPLAPARRLLPTLAGSVALVVLAAVLTAAPARAADVHGDDDRDVYVGTGGLILPGTVGSGTRREVAGCGGCAWRLEPVCVDPGLGGGFERQHACSGVPRGCALGRQQLRVWFEPEGRPWRPLDVVCLAEPVTVAQVGERVRDRVEEGMPALRPAFWPEHGAVTQLPVAFASGQPGGPRRWTMQVAGTPVEVVAEPTWTWSFGDGTHWRGSDPGGDYRRPTLTHTYGLAGRKQVEVVTRWSARYTIAGVGSFEVPEPITQAARLEVRVGEGRAVLVPR